MDKERTYSTKEFTRGLNLYKGIEEKIRELSIARNEAKRGRKWKGIDRIETFIDNVKPVVLELNHTLLTDKLKELEDELSVYYGIRPKQIDNLGLFPRVDGNVYSFPYYKNNGFPKKR